MRIARGNLRSEAAIEHPWNPYENFPIGDRGDWPPTITFPTGRSRLANLKPPVCRLSRIVSSSWVNVNSLETNQLDFPHLNSESFEDSFNSSRILPLRTRL